MNRGRKLIWESIAKSHLKNEISDFGAQNIEFGQNTGKSHLGGWAIFPSLIQGSLCPLTV